METLTINGYPARTTTGPCITLVPSIERPDAPRGDLFGPLCRCGLPGVGVVVSGLPAGRPDEGSGPLCPEHGGAAQAHAEVARAWCVVAPASVGGDVAVATAGCLSLGSEHCYLTVREAAPHRQAARVKLSLTREAYAVLTTRFGARSLRALGWRGPVAYFALATWRAEVRRLGWWLDRLPVPAAGQNATDEEIGMLSDDIRVVHEPALTSERAGTSIALGVGSHTHVIGQYATEEDALRVGVISWVERVAAMVRGITAARGGTLDWGMSVTPLSEPVVLRVEIAESGWDAGHGAPHTTPASAMTWVELVNAAQRVDLEVFADALAAWSMEPWAPAKPPQWVAALVEEA